MRPPGKPTRTDQLFAALRRAVSNAQPREARRNAWISETTWRLIDKIVSARLDPRYEQAFTRRIGKEVKKSLAEDRKRRADKAGAEVEALVKADPPLIREETVAGEAAGGTNADRPTFRRSTESRTEGATARGKTKRLDIRDDVETHRQESLCTPGPTIRAGFHTAYWKGGE